MCELDFFTTEELLAKTFAAQREAYQSHPDQENLDHMRDLIRREFLNVFGVFERERRRWHKDEEPGSERSFEAMSVRATAVASRVVRRLAVDDTAHALASGARRALDDVLVLRVDEAYAAMNRMFPLGNAPHRQIMAEVTAHPGWPQGWLVRRLTASGALIGRSRNRKDYAACEFNGSWSGWGTAPGLELVVLKRDGSGFLAFRSGERRHFDAGEPDDQLPHGPYGPEDYAPLRGGQKMEFDFWLTLDEEASKKYWSNRANSNDASPQGLNNEGADR
jgi:hypothetical protein